MPGVSEGVVLLTIRSTSTASDDPPQGGGGEAPADDPFERKLTADGEGLSRMQRALLQNPTRQGIVHEVGETPGMNKRQVGDALGLPPNGVRFHLDRLEESGLIVTKPGVRGNEVLCFLPGDERLWVREQTRVLYGQRGTRDVALFVAEEPGIASSGLSEALDIAVSTVRHHLDKLRDRRLIDRIRLGRGVEYYPSSTLEGWLEEVGYKYGVPWERDDHTGP